MSGDISAFAAEMVPYMSAAASAYGGAVLATLKDDAADATAGLGRRLLQRVFGTRTSGEKLPEPLADIVTNPQDEDATAALRLAIRKALQASPTLQAELEGILAQGAVRVTASGERSISSQTISGTAITGDQSGGILITGANPQVTMNIGASRTPDVAPLTGHEPERVVQISSLLPPGAGNIIRGRTFEDVNVVGPAIVTPIINVALESCKFPIRDGGSINEILWEITLPRVVVGVIGLENCSFRHCKFIGIGFMGSRDFLDLLKKDLGVQ